jgi:hypothetical protein
MDLSVLIWYIIFLIAMLLFFGTAVVITVVGVRDLRDLLSGSTTKK